MGRDLATYTPRLSFLTLDANWRWPGPKAASNDDEVLGDSLQNLRHLLLMKVSDRVIWSPEDEDGACGLLDAVPRSVVSLELLHTEFGLPEYIDEDETREFFNRQHHDTFDILLDEDDYWPNLRLVQIYNIRRKFFDENGLFDKDLED